MILPIADLTLVDLRVVEGRPIWDVLLLCQENIKGVSIVLLKECRRCGRLIPYGVPYCAECIPIVEAEREERLQESRLKANRKYNKTRDPKYIRFYRSAEWRTLSRKRLQDDGYRCVMCGAIASEVDHIRPIQTQDGWDHRLDYDNTRSLCLSCHNERHNRFKKKDQKGRTPCKLV